jgi:hypothetical protein
MPTPTLCVTGLSAAARAGATRADPLDRVKVVPDPTLKGGSDWRKSVVNVTLLPDEPAA